MKGRKLILGLAGAVGLSFGATNANATVDLDNYTLNFIDAANAKHGAGTAAALGLSNPTKVDEWRMLATSVVVFDNPGGFFPGSTFTDYIVVKVNAFFEADQSTQVATPGYGSAAKGAVPAGLGFPATHELTMVLKQTGKLVSFSGNPGVGVFKMDTETPSQWDIIFDVAEDKTDVDLDNVADTMTLATTGPGNWHTYTDGLLVEQINELSFGQGTLNNVVTPTNIDGSVDLKGPITDVLSTLGDFDEFEINYLDDQDLPFPEEDISIISGIADGNFSLNDNNFGLNGADETLIDAFLMEVFGVDYDPNTQTAFGFQSDASFNKDGAAIPEPVTSGLALSGLGALAGFATRRRR